MNKKIYHPFEMMKRIEENTSRVSAVEENVSALEGSVEELSAKVNTPKVLSSTPFETGETYKGKPVKKVALALNNSSTLNIGTNWTDLGIGIGTLPVGKVLNAYIISDENYVGSGVNFNFKGAVVSGSNITAKAAVSPDIGYPADLVFEYIEKDPAAEVSES